MIFPGNEGYLCVVSWQAAGYYVWVQNTHIIVCMYDKELIQGLYSKPILYSSWFYVLSVFVQEYTLSEYLRMSGIYWGLTVMDLMDQLPRMNRQEIIDFIKACQHECGGISASIGHDPHLLYTLSAVQVTAKTTLDLTIAAVWGWWCVVPYTYQVGRERIH